MKVEAYRHKVEPDELPRRTHERVRLWIKVASDREVEDRMRAMAGEVATVRRSIIEHERRVRVAREYHLESLGRRNRCELRRQDLATEARMLLAEHGRRTAFRVVE